MNSDFARAMNRATAAVRAQDLAEATAIIQAALAGAGSPDDPGAAAGAVRPRPFRIDPAAEDAELAEGPAAAGPRKPGARRGAFARMRRPLGEVVRTLREGRRSFFDPRSPAAAPGGRAPAPALPDGARFEWRSHASPAGARRYRLFVPSCAREEIRGLVLMLHGCKQDPDDFATGTGMNALAEEGRLLVAYPAQPGAANVSGCWNWFDPAHQTRDAGEPAILAGLTRALVAEFGVAPDRVFVAGLSAGGAMAAVLAETHPDIFAAAGIHSGLAFGSANDVMSAFAAMRGQGLAALGGTAPTPRPRLIVFHGTSDRTVHPSNAEDIVAAARAAVPEARLREERKRTADGRGYARSILETPDGTAHIEAWMIEGAGHAWSGGDPAGSYTDPSGPRASAEMLRFFLSES